MIQTKKPHLLLVEDCPEIATLLRTIAEDEGFLVSSVLRGDEAFALVAANRGLYTAIFLDLVLPGMHGLDLVRNLERLGDITRVVIYSGNITQEVHAQIRGHRAVVSCHPKPTPIPVFQKILRDMAAGRSEAPAQACDMYELVRMALNPSLTASWPSGPWDPIREAKTFEEAAEALKAAVARTDSGPSSSPASAGYLVTADTK